MSVKIAGVNQNSLCYKKKIRPGDELISINGNEINDVLDYRFYSDEERLKLDFLTGDNRRRTVKLKSPESADDIGLEFETYLMDRQKSCKNKCVFCFIDQLPRGLRPSLYFKDDDARLSFLFGNYITLTNLSEHDVERIIKMHISPINASVHTMDPVLRVKMMKNPAAGESLKYLYRFSEAGIKINVQLVLCPGINDNEALVFTLEKLKELKSLQSIAAVPVGLTKYRDNLCPLRKFTPEEAGRVIDTLDKFNVELISSGSEKLAYPSDEFYQLALRDIPPYDYYGDFPQLDNGVGMLSAMRYEFTEALEDMSSDGKKRSFALVTGEAAFELLRELTEKFSERFKNSDIGVLCIKNQFFGEDITVAGLLTGRDIIDQLKNNELKYDTLVFPSAMFRSREELVFLDDIELNELEKALGVKAVVADCDAYSLIEVFRSLGREE